MLIFGFTTSPISGAYVRGKLALAGVELSAPLSTWLDAVYAAYVDAPHEALGKFVREMVKEQAKLRPKEARETWGLLPEHQALSGRLNAKGGGAPTVGPKDTEEALAAWKQKQGARPPSRR